MAYSGVEDLMLGDIPLSPLLDKQKFVNDATDEIDSIIGALYVTPIDVADTSSVARHSRLLLKRVANFLASGRLIMTVDSGGEDTQLHAYALRLVSEALGAVVAIRDGTIVLDGATKQDGIGDTTTPAVVNVDAASAVEAFYQRVMAPESDLVSGLPYRDWAPGSDPRGTGIAW